MCNKCCSTVEEKVLSLLQIKIDMGLLEMLGLKAKVNFKEIYENGAIIIDVRTKGEYSHGSYKGSINIPLDKINAKVKDVKKKNKSQLGLFDLNKKN